jgi:hypothetical protein
VNLYSFNRYFNIVGNVLGLAGYHTNYESYTTVTGSQNGSSCDTSIYRLGWGGNCSNSDNRGDPTLRSTLMRWGNYDTKNAASRFLASEVPTGLSDYPNAVPANNTLPPSFYLNSKPTWWPSAKAWPLIGPDVTGGNISGFAGHAYTTPAHDCFTSISGNVANFNATACYGGGTSVQQPVPPSGLQAVVQTTSP